MTSDDFGTVDIDLLADYIDGALDGPRRAEVEQLIATDPQWRETYELLVPGMVAAGAELTAMGARPEPMPADVVARLDAALAAPIAAPATIDPELAAPVEPHLQPTPVDGSAAGRHLSLVPETGGDRPVAPARSTRRRLRWAAPIAAAAGIIAFAGFGASYVAGTQNDSAESTAAGSPAEDAAPMMGADDAAQSEIAPALGLASLPPEELILATGTNYTGAALQDSANAYEGEGRTTQSPPSSTSRATDPELAALQRLQDRDALLECLNAIARQNEGPIEVQRVDFARFQGTPAVIVRFLFEGDTKGWAVGPECGTPSAGADRL